MRLRATPGAMQSLLRGTSRITAEGLQHWSGVAAGPSEADPIESGFKRAVHWSHISTAKSPEYYEFGGPIPCKDWGGVIIVDRAAGYAYVAAFLF